jgi:hypothetical protein
MLDEISEAVLAREEVVKYLRGGYGEKGVRARDRIYAYWTAAQDAAVSDYRALQHPLYLILRKIGARRRTCRRRRGSRHRVVRLQSQEPHRLSRERSCSTTTARGPLIAAGINLFGGPLGLLRHVIGAIPIRATPRILPPDHAQGACRGTAEKHDLLYPEGGRSYSGELKPVKTGLINAALTAERPDLVIVPVAIAYDLVLEDHVLARQRVKKRQRAFARELAEMVRYAVGYRSRAFVTFGSPIPVGDCDPQSRSDVMALTRLVRARIGGLYKVLPTAVFAAAMRPSITRRDLESRIDRLIEELGARHANLGVASGKEAVDQAAEPLETRGIVVLERGRFRVRERSVLRYYGRTIEHLLVTTGRTH